MSESDPSGPQPSPDLPQREKSKTLEQIIRENAPEVLNSIPQKARPKLAQVRVEFYKQEVSLRTGPLPAPEELAAYNQVIPEGADRIMKMAEQQSAHRISLESTVVNSQQKQSFCGQIFGLIIGLAGLGFATFAAVHGQPWFGSIIGGTTLVSLVSVFVYARRGQHAELNKKREQMESSRQLRDRKPAK
jgi:uncharacterized membrane protein